MQAFRRRGVGRGGGSQPHTRVPTIALPGVPSHRDNTPFIYHRATTSRSIAVTRQAITTAQSLALQLLAYSSNRCPFNETPRPERQQSPPRPTCVAPPTKKCHFTDFLHKSTTGSTSICVFFLYDNPSLCHNFDYTFGPKMRYPAMDS